MIDSNGVLGLPKDNANTGREAGWIVVGFIDEIKRRKNVFFGLLIYSYIVNNISSCSFFYIRSHVEILSWTVLLFLFYVLIMFCWRKARGLFRGGG